MTLGAVPETLVSNDTIFSMFNISVTYRAHKFDGEWSIVDISRRNPCHSSGMPPMSFEQLVQRAGILLTA
jgi:hypothetical protein